MGLPVIPLAAAIALFAVAVYKFIIYPTFVSPLAQIPNAHWTSSISPLWILYQRQQQNDTPTVDQCHKRLGPIIRLAPNEISVNSVDGGIKTVYTGGFEKGDWYSNVFSNYGVEPMFAMEKHGDHSKRKRMLSNIYAKSSLQSSPTLTKQTGILINHRLRPRLLESAKTGEAFEMYDVFAATTMDFVCSYIFGMKNGSDFIKNKEEGIMLFHDFKARQKYTFWPQELPNVTAWLKKLGLKFLVVPSWVDSANFDIESWVMGMCEKAEKTWQANEQGEVIDVEDTPTVYTQLRHTLLKESMKGEEKGSIAEHVQSLRLSIASELLDHTLAGFDTSSITLTWLAWQLSRPAHKQYQTRLQAEISTLKDSLDAKTIDSLPLLHAILMESLRLHAAIPGNQPRITPAAPLATLGDTEKGIVYKNLPPNTRVQAQAWSLHRNPAVYPDPETWNPDRWLQATPEQHREMTRWFWAFGSGGRMCVGSNLAILDMKAAIVGIWGAFGTEIVDDEGMVPNGGYMAEPLGVGPGGKKGIGGKYGSPGGGGQEQRRFLRVKVTEISAS